MSHSKVYQSWYHNGPYSGTFLNGEKNSEVSFFEIVSLQDYYAELPAHKIPHPMNCYGIVWVIKGSGILKVDTSTNLIEQNTLLYFSPGQLMQLQTDDHAYGYLIRFSADFLLLSDSLVNNAFADSSFSEKQSLTFPDLEIAVELEDLIAKMKREHRTNNPFQKQILTGLLKVFILYLSRSEHVLMQERVPDREREMVRKFMSLVKAHFLTRKMVTDYARELCVSPNYLNRIVKKISGNTASHHIQQCIVMEAKRQAIYSNLSMKEVAYSLGFNDYAHFSKFFKNNSGTNFSCFKNEMQ